ncbi:MAG: 5-formyltetrahydrofolate cyclo-ligase [Methanocorpusculum sp.]|nr:5-formyltetrahydrofolate cyclo-ligase [Methanocorpusculum sp.]
MTDKAALRAELKTRREAIPLGMRREKSYCVTEHLKKILSPYTTILAYVSKDPEVESMVIINALISEGKHVIVPIIERETHTLRLSYLTSMEQLEPGTFQVPEPLSAEIPADAADVEAVLLPLVGFDRTGNRIGYGAGYYDRFLEQHPEPVRIGMAYACQEVACVPAEPFDIKMHYVVTEDGIMDCQADSAPSALPSAH